MTEIEIAREKVISAALALAANRIYQDVSEPGPYDDAQSELDDEILDIAIAEYVKLKAS